MARHTVADAKHRPVQLALPDWTGDLYRRIAKLADQYTTLEHECKKLARTMPLASLHRFPSLRRQKQTLEKYRAMPSRGGRAPCRVARTHAMPLCTLGRPAGSLGSAQGTARLFWLAVPQSEPVHGGAAGQDRAPGGHGGHVRTRPNGARAVPCTAAQTRSCSSERPRRRYREATGGRPGPAGRANVAFQPVVGRAGPDACA